MAQAIARYDGTKITCYPGSNQSDDGKLNLESNMARIVTRLSSKNFCIINPSFEITAITDIESNLPKLQVDVGQASINGMDLVMTDVLVIDPPETSGTYYLAFKLARDSSFNVLGDLVYGATRTFEGVYLTYYTEKPNPVDNDQLFIGQVTWDGTQFLDIVEDSDKYGRIWAQDILCKIDDPKHPTVDRLTLQQWLYNTPNWYVSKEGDSIYGALDFIPGREGNSNPGLRLQCVDNNTNLYIKAPSVEFTDTNLAGGLFATDESIGLNLGTSNIYTQVDDDFTLHMNSTKDICVRSSHIVKIQGEEGVEIGSSGNGNDPKLTLLTHKATFNDSNNTDLEFSIDFTNVDSYLQQTVGKSVWKYENDTNNLILLSNNTNNLIINPNSIFKQNTRIEQTLTLGESDGLPQTSLGRLSWWMRENVVGGKTVNYLPTGIILTNPTLSTSDNISILLKNGTDTIHTKILDDAKIELVNNSRNPSIVWKDGTVTYDTVLEKIIGEKRLNIQGNLSLVNLISSGNVSANNLTAANGVVTFQKGSNNATITKDENLTNLRTSNALYIGTSGNSNLYAGNTVINGNIGIGGDTYNNSECKIDNNGNINTSGTITGSKVFNACYNGFGEIFRKNKEEIIEYGDVVCIREDGLVHKVSSIIDLQTIIGICSDTIGVQMGGKDIPKDEQVEVEMVGQIWVKTSNPNIVPGKIVKVLPDGTVGLTNNRNEKFGIAITNTINNKVRIVYNG